MDVSGREPTDEQLAERAAAGDEPAFEAIVNRYQSRVFRLAWRLMASESDAADVLQETFLQVYRKLATFRGESRFGTWLYRIATNAALMQRRARSRRPSEPLDGFLPCFDENGRHAATVAELHAAASLEQQIDRRRLAEKALVALDRLPEGYREAFVLRDLEELTTAEVGEVLGLEPAAVRQRVHRARMMLRGYMGALTGAKA